jgi:hypothetical protein
VVSAGFTGQLECAAAEFGALFEHGSEPQRRGVSLASPLDACSPIAPSNGSIVLAYRGGCAFSEKVRHVVDSGAVMCG